MNNGIDFPIIDNERIFETESIRQLDIQELDTLAAYIEVSNNLETYLNKDKDNTRYYPNEWINYDRPSFIDINPSCIPRIVNHNFDSSELVEIYTRALADGTPIPNGLDAVKRLFKETNSGFIVRIKRTSPKELMGLLNRILNSDDNE